MTRLKIPSACKYASGMTLVVMAALSTGCGAGTLHEAVRSADEKVLAGPDEVELNAASAQRLAHRWMRSQMRHVVLREGLQQLDGLEPCSYFRADLAYRAAKSDPLASCGLRRADAGRAALSYAHRLTDANRSTRCCCTNDGDLAADTR